MLQAELEEYQCRAEGEPCGQGSEGWTAIQ